MKKIFRKILKFLWLSFKFLFAVVLLTIVLKVCVLASFKIPSNSMSPVLEAGDFVLVNKLIIGGRLHKSFVIDASKTVETFRLWGFRKVKRGDVLIFNFPYRDNPKIEFNFSTFYVKRCVAIAGDTLQIENGFYRVNGNDKMLGNAERQMLLSQMEDNVFPSEVFHIFPYGSPFHYWTMKNAGPLYIPEKNAVVPIDSVNFYLYSRLIEYETQQSLKRKEDKILLNDSVINEYRFTRNYYFMAGDNVLDSHDSRYWGLLPEEMIVGKAAIIWKSEDTETGKIRWKRVLKVISD